MQNHTCGGARLVLRFAPEPRQQIIELEEADRHKAKGLHVHAGAYGRSEGSACSKIRYAKCYARIAERFVRGAEQHMRERRDAGRKGDLRPEEIRVQV